MVQDSTWRPEAGAVRYPELDGSLDADVAIVGGGLTGITAAHLLSAKGLRVVVLERGSLGAEATGLTTAFLVETIDTDPETLVSIFDEQTARTVLSSHRHAIDVVEETVRTEGIDCAFSRCPLHVFASSDEDGASLPRQGSALRSLGTDASLDPERTLGFATHGSLRVERQAKFHPLRYLHALARTAVSAGVEIYENTEVAEVDEAASRLQTARGSVRARHMLVATHYPLGKPWPLYFKKAEYVSYVCEFSMPCGVVPEALYEDTANPYHYFRVDKGDRKDRLIIGGADHRADIPVDAEANFADIEHYARRLLPHVPLAPVRRWKGPIVEPGDGLAYIGPVHPGSDVFYATGYSGNGMTYSVLAAEIFAARVLGESSPWAEVYAARRPPGVKSHLTKAKQYLGEFARGAVRNTLRFLAGRRGGGSPG